MSMEESIRDVAGRLGVPAQWLDALINFETGGSYSVTARNPISGAMGLIQVTNKTARDEFGAADSAALSATYPSFESYMENVVYPYLEKYIPYQTKQAFYMAVFYPAFRDVEPSTTFPKYVQDSNPGITTVQSYIDFVDRRVKNGIIPKAFPALAALAGAGAILYFVYGR